MRPRVVFSLAWLALLLGSAAHADIPVTAPANVHRDQTFELDLGGVAGFSTPIGDYGIEAQVGITPWFAIAAGVGRELLGSHGNQVAVMPRVRVPLGGLTIYGGLGGAWGHRREPSRCLIYCGPTEADGEARYFTAEVGLEAHAEEFFTRVFAGGKAMTNLDEVCQVPGQCEHYFAYGGFAGGVRF